MNFSLTSSFSTGKYHGCSIKYSPRTTNVVACAAAENYGIVGKGRLYILDFKKGKEAAVIAELDHEDGLLDVSWNKLDANLIATSSRSGSVQIWDYVKSMLPVAEYRIHSEKVPSIDWNPENTNLILSASVDKSVRAWDLFVCCNVSSFLEHSGEVHQARWSYHCPQILGTVSEDKTLRLWDIRDPGHCNGCYPHNNEVFCLSWSKTDQDVVATGTLDGEIFQWDVRKMLKPFFILTGHGSGVRQLKYSPLARGLLASVSYDLTTRFWLWNVSRALQIREDHTEFVSGLDFSPLTPNQVCDCAWDSTINIYKNSF